LRRDREKIKDFEELEWNMSWTEFNSMVSLMKYYISNIKIITNVFWFYYIIINI